MSLNIKSFILFFLLIGFSGYSQDDDEEILDENLPDRQAGQMGETGPEDGYRLFILSAGGFQPFAVGDNFANSALNVRWGIQNTFMFNLLSTNILLGVHMKIHTAETTDRLAVGNYESTTYTLLGFVAGYWFHLGENIRFLPKIGVGHVSYKNHGDDNRFNFRDEGTSVWITPTLSYKFTRNFGVYVSGDFRHDFLEIEAPGSLQDYFDHADYVSFGLGIQFSW